MSERITHWIGGKPWTGAPGRTGEVHDPATGQVTGLVDLAGATEVDAAVAAAREAGRSWARTSLATRTSVLFRFRELLADRAGDLARVITAEHGKVRSDAAGEVARGVENVEVSCGIPTLLQGGFSENVSTSVDVHSLRQPLGVVAVISPFNFPAMVPLWFTPNAIACGNAVVLKPSEKDPSAANLLAELWAQAGLPDGVFTVLHGDKVAVDGLLDHPDVAGVSFVGSTPVAKYVHGRASANGTRVQALGGAKNHMVVLPDADLDAAADAAVSAGFGSAGERCMAISVVVAVGPIGDDLVSRIRDRTAVLTVGNGMDESVQMGPLVTAAHRDRVVGFLEAGVAEGATLAVDGRGHDLGGADAEGFWLGPSLFDHVRPEMSVYTEEIFGPVLSVVRVPDYDSAVALVNAHRYGNGTAIFTTDGGAARRFTAEVEVGMVGVNVAIPVPVASYSFGGWKDSLFGDLHAYGPDAIRFYTRTKVVTSRWSDPATRGSGGDGVNLVFPASH